MIRKLMESGVVIEVDKRPDDVRIALVHPNRTAEWEISHAEADALTEALMIETVRE